MINGTSSRRCAVAALALAAAVGLVACTTSGPAAAPPAAPPAAAPSPAPAVPPGFAPAPVRTIPLSSLDDQPLAVDTSASAHGPYVPWHLIGVDTALNRITISAQSSGVGCLTPSRVHLDETASEIRITFEAVGPTDPSTVCTADLVTVIGWVAPHAPIGTRRIVHGPGS